MIETASHLCAGPATDDHVYLIGGTPFPKYRAFMLGELGSAIDRWAMAEDWRIAEATLLELAITEAGWADDPSIDSIPSSIQDALAGIEAHRVFQHAFTGIPAEFGIVELDRLVVRQTTINLAQVQRIKERFRSIDGLPSGAPFAVLPRRVQELVLQTCFPLERETMPHGVSRDKCGTFVFTSDSNDLRVLATRTFSPEDVDGCDVDGAVVAVVGVVIGYGSNYLNAIATSGRLVLHNGTHRAYALRELGFTHVPCIIQKPRTDAELLSIAPRALRQNADLYLKEPRPPVFKDYFDPRLRKLLPLRRAQRRVTITIQADERDYVD
jgi:hypothetical protein